MEKLSTVKLQLALAFLHQRTPKTLPTSVSSIKTQSSYLMGSIFNILFDVNFGFFISESLATQLLPPPHFSIAFILVRIARNLSLKALHCVFCLKIREKRLQWKPRPVNTSRTRPRSRFYWPSAATPQPEAAHISRGGSRGSG